MERKSSISFPLQVASQQLAWVGGWEKLKMKLKTLMISLGRAYNWTEPVCGTHSDWENFYSLSQQMCPAGYFIQGSKCSSIFWVYQSIWGWGIKNTFIFRCALLVLLVKHNSYISFWTPEKNSVNSNPTTGTYLTTHFSSLPLEVSEWSGLVSNQHQWSLFLSESCFSHMLQKEIGW